MVRRTPNCNWAFKKFVTDSHYKTMPSQTGRVVYSACSQYRRSWAWTLPKSPPMLVDHCKYVDQKGLAAILTSPQSAGVTPEENLRITLVRKHTKRNPPWLWNPEQTSPEVQKTGISGPTKRTCPPKILKKKKTKYLWTNQNRMFFRQGVQSRTY